jgi:hypothetical protein
MSQEIIYILINEAMPGYVKIGKTSTSIEQRIRELSGTSVPLPFTCFYACTVKDMHFAEKQLHDAFDDSRVNPNREFFQISPERVVSALKLAEIEDITPRKELVDDREDRNALNNARARRSVFRFSLANIPLGAELIFSRDESKKAYVIDDRNIQFNGGKTSLSTAAQNILGYEYGVAGTDYWKYEGETLFERRKRIELEEENKESHEIKNSDNAADLYTSIVVDQLLGK